MIFWILLAIAVVIVVVAIIVNARYGDWGAVFFVSVFTALGLGALTIVLMSLTYYFQTGGVQVDEERKGLTALQTQDAIEGQFAGGIFISRGYVGSTPVLSYISEGDDGGFRAEYAKADRSVIYEGEAEDPHVITRTYDFFAAWLVPWPIATEDRYSFHVPDGSVVTSYEVTP